MVIEAEENRRDFLILATGAVGVAGTAAAAWPFIRSWSPTADVLAQATTEVDISALAEGQMITIPWQGKPIFILHRTAEQISQAKEADSANLPDPAQDKDRVQKRKIFGSVGTMYPSWMCSTTNWHWRFWWFPLSMSWLPLRYIRPYP